MPVVFVSGNHENYGSDIDIVEESLRTASAGTAIRYLERDRVDLAGIRFLACALQVRCKRVTKNAGRSGFDDLGLLGSTIDRALNGLLIQVVPPDHPGPRVSRMRRARENELPTLLRF